MTENIDLEELEKKIYQSYFQDGLWDIFMGWLIVGMGLSSLSTYFGLPETVGLFVVLLSWNMTGVIIMGVGKKRITMPRLGLVKFGPKRQADKKKLSFFLGIMVGVNFIVLTLTITGSLQTLPFSGLAMPIFLGLSFISVPFFIVAYYIDYNRLYYYGLLLGLSLFFADLLYPILGSPLDGIIVFCSIGSPIIVIGVNKFIRFLKKYPKPEGVRGDGEEEGE
jgi:hypothetical protein